MPKKTTSKKSTSGKKSTKKASAKRSAKKFGDTGPRQGGNYLPRGHERSELKIALLSGE